METSTTTKILAGVSVALVASAGIYFASKDDLTGVEPTVRKSVV